MGLESMIYWLMADPKSMNTVTACKLQGFGPSLLLKTYAEVKTYTLTLQQLSDSPEEAAFFAMFHSIC